jgi:phage terminase large subunit GpA-like protein
MLPEQSSVLEVAADLLLVSDDDLMLADAAKVYTGSFWDGLRPDPLLTVSEWADAHRMLSSKASAEPGRWRTARTPYLREIMDALSPTSPVERVVFMKGSQVGGTEAGQNWIGYVIAHRPGPMMMVQPTVDIAKRVSRQRLDPLIQESPILSCKVKPARERDSGNTLLMKEFQGGVLMLAGANSAAGLRSMPIRDLFCDEVDAYPGDVEGEGDPVELAIKRTATFARRKQLLVSTPTINGRSRIETAFEDSDRRYYQVPCPHCMHKQVIRWPNLKWDKSHPETAALACVDCGALIPEHHKEWMLENGEWVPENPDHRIRGYHLSALYSPLGWFSWADAVRQFEASKGRPDQLRVFVNTVLGETWAEQGEAPEWEKLYLRREPYERNRIPRGGLFLTAGVDVQVDRLEVEVVAWGRAHESWSVDYRVIPGDTAGDAPWDILSGMLNEQWLAIPGENEEPISLPLKMLAVDTGFNTQRAYAWVRTQPSDRVIAVKGQDGLASIIGHPRAMDINYAGKRIARGVKLWPVGVDLIKSEVYGRLRLEPSVNPDERPFGWCHFPEYSEDYFKMLTAEQKVARIVRGYRKFQWEKTRERNEALDCRVYARAAAAVVGIDRFTDDHWDYLATSLPLPTPRQTDERPTRGDSYLGRREGSWLSKRR